MFDLLLDNLVYLNEENCCNFGQKQYECLRNYFKRCWRKKEYLNCNVIINKLMYHEKENLSYMHLKGACLFKLKKYSEAISIFKIMYDNDKSYINHHTLLAICLFQSEDFKTALFYIDFVLSYDDDNFICVFMKAKLYIKERNFGKAIMLLEKCEALKWVKEQVYYEMAYIYVEKSKYKKAEEYFRILIQIKPEIVEYHIMIMKCLILKDEIIEAKIYQSNLSDYYGVRKGVNELVKDFNLFRDETFKEDLTRSNTNEEKKKSIIMIILSVKINKLEKKKISELKTNIFIQIMN